MHVVDELVDESFARVEEEVVERALQLRDSVPQNVHRSPHGFTARKHADCGLRVIIMR